LKSAGGGFKFGLNSRNSHKIDDFFKNRKYTKTALKDFTKPILKNTNSVKKGLEHKDILYRLWLLILFLMRGLSMFAPPIFMTEDVKTIYLISHPVLFLLVAVLIRRNAHLEEVFSCFPCLFLFLFGIFS